MSAADARPEPGAGHNRRRWMIYVFMLGIYLSMRGYHSFDGDQTYRLPLLLHHQDPSVFADDPFVRAFDEFNPHRGSIMVLDLITRPLGLSGGLFFLFVMTFGATCMGVDRLARSIWPEAGSQVGPVAVGLLLAAKAGNIGTNHLFEAMVLDRLMAFALGWLALAEAVVEPRRRPWRGMAAIALATLIHPSVGLQLALVLIASWVFWSLFGRWMDVSQGVAVRRVVGLVIAVIPGLVINLGPGASLQGSMPADVFWQLSVELQSPQHMLPHLWRMPQWLSWGCYLMLAGLALSCHVRSMGAELREDSDQTRAPMPWPRARLRLVGVLAVILVGLGTAWYAIEGQHLVRVTVFQPFRMATVTRGIALVFVAGRIVALWRSGGSLGRMRAIVMAAAFTGDWLLVVVTLAELAVSLVEWVEFRLLARSIGPFVNVLVLVTMLGLGLNFLARHDTEYGNRTLLAVLGVAVLVGFVGGRPLTLPAGTLSPWGRGEEGNGRARVLGATVLVWALAWAIPVASLIAAAVPIDHAASRHPLACGLINRCRFAAVPADDVERLGLWCREHTPASARMIGPPGPKTLRLWSRRSVAFNRAASPYHAAGLADWFARFQDHVNFHGSASEFVRAYVSDRHGFEARYQAQTDAERADLAFRQGADYVVAFAPADRDKYGNSRSSPSPLELLHVEGRYAVYRVRPELLVQRQR